MPNWTVEEVEHEHIKIDSSQFIEEARRLGKRGEYPDAERRYLAAVQSSRGGTYAIETAAVVKKELSEVYIKWAKRSRGMARYQEAYTSLQKLDRISDDKYVAKYELRDLYLTWGMDLEGDPEDWRSALIVFFKRLRLETELGYDTDLTASHICKAMYRSREKRLKKAADQLFIGIRGYRISFIIATVIMAIAALVIPFFAPSSAIVYCFSFVFFQVDGLKEDIDDRYYKKAVKKIIIISFTPLILAVVGGMSWWKSPLYIFGSYTFIMVVSIMFTLSSIKRFRIIFSYEDKEPMNIMEEVFPAERITCRSCGVITKADIDCIDQIKCKKCGAVLRKAAVF